MYSDKEGVKYLLHVLQAKRIRHFVISPGSRNAPLTISLTAQRNMHCISIVDERSAGFFALGMARQLNEPVGLVCTSGTAALNYAPALAEAYYQRIPLIAITADRPEELIDQREGQAIKQQQLFKNYTKASLQLPQEPYDADRLWYLKREVANTLQQAISAPQGPVHLNVPLREPLYHTDEKWPSGERVVKHLLPKAQLSDSQWKQLATGWQQAKKILVVIGATAPAALDKASLQQLHEAGAVILAEHIANAPFASVISSFDALLYQMPEEEKEDYMPDLLIYAGRDLVSKRLKQFLRQAQPEAVWAVDEAPEAADTFKNLSLHIRMKLSDFLTCFASKLDAQSTAFQRRWYNKAAAFHEARTNFEVPWSDFMAFQEIMPRIPAHSMVHLGNSSPARYAMLFAPRTQVHYYANRGTSGIDGVISTAAGAAYSSPMLTFVLAGDLSFSYDSNALWNNQLPQNLRIVVINNQGGGIFGLIPGPPETPAYEQFFKTHVPVNFEKLAGAYGVDYIQVSGIQELRENWPSFATQGNKAVVLEVVTPGETNSRIFQSFFKHIKQQLWEHNANGPR